MTLYRVSQGQFKWCTRRWTILQCLAIAASVLGQPVLAHADDRAEAGTHFKRGVTMYREGNLKGALAEFARANELAPDFRLLYNMAQVQAERHDYVRTIELLQAYLQEGGTAVAASRRSEVDAELERLRTRVAALWVGVDAEEGTLWVNDIEVATLPLEKHVLLNIGTARIRVESAGRKTYQREINVAGGDSPRLEIALERVATVTVVRAPSAPDVDFAPVWISGIAAASLGIGAVTFAMLTNGTNADLSEQLNTFPTSESDVEATRGKLRLFAGLTDGFMLASLAAVGLGSYYLAFPLHQSTPRESPLQPGTDLHVAIAPTGITASGTF